MKRLIASPAGKLAALAVVLAMTMLSLQAAQSAQASSSPAAATSARPIAHTGSGSASSRIVGSTAGGRDVTGSFVPLKFLKRNGKLYVRGLVDGVVQKPGPNNTFAQLRTIRVKSINGTPARAGSRAVAARATCRILHLVLAPLNLNLLGLRVHLDRVLLNIVAVSGAGNLLGNLLCAVAGLLDGGVGGLLGRLTNLLNRILGNLRLG